MSQYDDIQKDATTGGGEGDPAASTDDIQVYIEQILEGYGSTHYDTDTLPVTAEARPNGIFSSYQDLERYLEGGGLLFKDENGNNVPNPIVHIYIHEDEYSDDDIYEVWIDSDTQAI